MPPAEKQDEFSFSVTYSSPTTETPESARSTLLAEAAGWLEALSADHDPTTVKHYGLYLRTHWTPHFRWLSGITTPRAREYMLARLRKVTDQTVEKELSALRGLVAWAHEQGFIAELPAIPSPPRCATPSGSLHGRPLRRLPPPWTTGRAPDNPSAFRSGRPPFHPGRRVPPGPAALGPGTR